MTKQEIKKNLKENWTEALLLYAVGFSVCFLFGSGLGFLYHGVEELVGILDIVMGIILGISMYIYMIKRKLT